MLSQQTQDLLVERRRLMVLFNAAPENSPKEEELLQRVKGIDQQLAQQSDYRRRNAEDSYGVALGLLSKNPTQADV